MAAIDWTAADATVAAAIRARGIESDLADADLNAYAQSAISEIASRGYGPQTDVITYHDGTGQRYLLLDPAASTVSEVTEEGVSLDEDDNGYRIRSGGRYLERLDSGYPSAWSGRIVVTRDAQPADERYDRVVIDLVKLALEYSGLDSRREGDYFEEAAGARGGGLNSYQMQREQVIAELAPAWDFA